MSPVLALTRILLVIILSVPQASRPLGSADEALLRAAERNDLPEVVSALAQGAKINATTAGGATAVLLAAQHGNLEMVKLLVEMGASLSIQDSFYLRTPVDEAIARDDVAMVEYLNGKGSPWAEHVLAFAVEKKQIAILKDVVRRPDIPDIVIAATHALTVRNGDSALAIILEAAMNTRPDAAKSLAPVPPSTLQTFTGAYRDDRTAQTIVVTLREDHLVAILGPRSLMLFAMSPSQFRAPEMPNTVFSFSTRGTLTRLRVDTRGMNLDLLREQN